MAREPFIIDKNEWQRMFDKFCNEVYAKKRKPIPYQLFRQIKNGPQKDAQVSFYDDGIVEIYDVARVGKPNFDMYSGEINDGSFGSYLSEYFQEEGKMYPDDKPVYDLWGLASESLTSVNKAEDNCCIAADGIGAAKVTTWAGDPYYNYADSCSTVSTSYTTITDINSERIKELETAVTRLQEEVAQKVNVDDVYHLENDLHQRIDELAWCADDHEAAIKQFYDEIEALSKINVQSTSSNCYPVKNYKIDIAGGCVCDNDRKEKENMDTNKMFTNFEFGPADDRVKMSPFGIAIRNADGRYVSYDVNTGNIVDVEVFNFDNHNLIYKMPVALSAVSVGDTIIHMKKPMFVTSIVNGITVIDIYNGEVKLIVPATNMFGFNFVTKVVSLFNFTGMNAPSADNPFGNILPFMLMGENKDFNDILPLMLMTDNAGMFGNMAQNPLMLYALMGDKGSNMDPLMMMALMGGFNPATSAAHEHVCTCGCNHDHEHHHE